MFNLLSTYDDILSCAKIPDYSRKLLTKWLKFSIEDIIGRKNILSVYIVGSLARGDFVAINHKEWYPISDFDFLFVVKQLSNRMDKISFLSEKLSPLLAPSNKLFHIGLKIRHPTELEQLHPLYRYDWKNHGILIMGEETKTTSFFYYPSLLSVIALRVWYCCLYASIWMRLQDTKYGIVPDFLKFSYTVARLGIDVSRCLQINPAQKRLLQKKEQQRIEDLMARTKKFKQKVLLTDHILRLDEIHETLLLMLQIGERLLIEDQAEENNKIYQSMFLCGKHLIKWVECQSTVKNFRRTRTTIAERILKSSLYMLRDHENHYNRIFNL